MPSIEIIVSTSGESQVQTKGLVGATCRTSSQFIEQALGTATNEQLTPEFYQIQVSSEVAESHTI